MPLILSVAAAAAVDETVSSIEQGHIVVYPTDTIYGLGCDALNQETVERIKAIKGRDGEKPFILLASSIEELVNYFIIENMENMLKKIWPGPFTVLLQPLPDFPAYLAGPNGKVAVRIPGDTFLEALFLKWKGLLISTSANLSHKPYKHEWGFIKNNFFNHADLLIHRAPYPVSKPSAVIDYDDGEWKVLREGPQKFPLE
ncbi:MAG: threonylcarbamoyl-AMP synthase [Fibrobacteria bacterium]|nr:threonylcarbamoyl-AMP synthase [Fibrobacteria bacterium]